MAAKGEIVINAELCKGCGYCANFCPQDCIVMSDKFNSKGYFIPDITEPDKCNGCAICGQLCPDFAIEVYRYQKAAT